MASFILNLELRPAEFILGILVLQFRHRLAEVYVNTSIIDQDVVHLEIGVFAVLRLLELNEGVLQRFTRLVILDDLTADDVTEAREDHLQVLR